MSLTTSASAAKTRRERGREAKSSDARSIALTLLDTPRAQRRTWLASLAEHERTFVFQEVERETGSLYGLWHDDPIGFTEDVIGETVWGLQGRVLHAPAIPRLTRVIVPAGFGVGKTYVSGRMVAWAGAVNPIGTITIATIAPKWRQVRNQLWPHVKMAVAKGGLPGKTDTAQWIADDQYGNRTQIAYGFAASPNDEAAMQGIHGTPKLLLIVEEAGGISRMIGAGTNNLLTGDAKMLAIGNPAMDDPGSWLEKQSEKGADPEERDTLTIPISTLDSPAVTGAPTPICRACNPNRDGHTIAEGVNGKSHLPDWEWLRNTLGEYGISIDRECRDVELVKKLCLDSGHPYLIAKVLAMFPKTSGNLVIPAAWVEAAALAEDPMDHTPCGDAVCNGGTEPAPCQAVALADNFVDVASLGLDGETESLVVARGSWVRLGVDVAADGGDEFSVSRSIGDLVHNRHASAGAQNADVNVVEAKILAEIDAAVRLSKAIGSHHRVRVKIDANGLGWGVAGHLKAYVESGRIDADIVAVMVSQAPEKDDESAVMRPALKRDEMWLAGRFLMQPDPGTGFGRLRLRVDDKTKTQLTTPRLGNNAAGRAKVESKQLMKARGVHSPDRAESVLLAIYEPIPVGGPKRFGVLG